MYLGGRIDHAHHETRAHRAIDETLEFEKAVQEAMTLTDPDDTLIVITADHAHVMSLGGYPARGENLFGKFSITLIMLFSALWFDVIKRKVST